MYTIIGYRVFIGTSKKTGKDFDFVRLYCTFEDDSISGKGCEVVSCNGSEFRRLQLAVGSNIAVLKNGGIYVI